MWGQFSYTRALVREVAATFDRSLSSSPAPLPIHPSLAAQQHAAYHEALLTALEPSSSSSSETIITVPTDDQFPDCVFI